MTALRPDDRELAARYVPLARSVAREWSRSRPHLRDEIESAAMLGLTLAAEGYLEELNVSFYTYAKRVIGNAIRKEIRQSRPLGYRLRADGPSVSSLNPGVERFAVRPRGDVSIEQLEQREEWERQLRRFRPGHRPLIRLLFEEDLTITEAGRELGLDRAETLALYSAALASIGVPVRPTRRRVVITRPRRRREVSCHSS